MPTLPFVVTGECSRLTMSPRLGSRTNSPPTPPCKRYLRHSVELVRLQTLENARKFGSAAAEEWLHGLEVLATKRQRDAQRWIRWEANGGGRAAKQSLFPKAVPQVVPLILGLTLQNINDSSILNIRNSSSPAAIMLSSSPYTCKFASSVPTSYSGSVVRCRSTAEQHRKTYSIITL
jgi:hypothetical protein